MTCRVSPASSAGARLQCSELRLLPHHAADNLGLHNRLHRRYAPWQIGLNGERLTVSWGAGPEACEQAVCVPVVVTLGEIRLQLDIPVQLLQLSGWKGELADGPLSDLDAMLFELAWLSWIEPLEATLGVPLRVSAGAGDKAGCPFSVALQVRVGDQPPLTVMLHMHTAAAERIAEWLVRFAAPLPDPLDALRLTLAVQAAEAPLTLGELHSLEPGDVVMLDRLADEQCLLRLGDSFACCARRQGDRLECLTPLAAVSPDAMNFAALDVNRKFLMTDTDTPMPAASDRDASLDELPIKLVCQIGSVELRLSELREMGPGSLLQLTGTAQDSVDLMVNGRRIGRGELVTIGDGLGVRLLGFTAP